MNTPFGVWIDPWPRSYVETVDQVEMVRNLRATAELEAEAEAGFDQAVELAVRRLRGGSPSASTVESLLSAELRHLGLESEDTARVAEQLAAALAPRTQAAERQPEVAR